MLLVAGCDPTRITLDVMAQASGSGYVSVTVDVPARTAAEVPDLRSGIPTADLLAAGWRIAPERKLPGGEVVLVANHPFSALSQVPALAEQVAGHNVFRVALGRATSALHSVYNVQAHVDLRCGLGCFADPALARSVGYGLGLPPGQLRRVLGPRPDRDMVFTVDLSLPGKAIGGQGPGTGRVTRSFNIALGRAGSAGFRTEVVNVPALRRLVGAVSAGSLVVLLSAVVLVARHRRTGRRARSRARRRRARL